MLLVLSVLSIPCISSRLLRSCVAAVSHCHSGDCSWSYNNVETHLSPAILKMSDNIVGFGCLIMFAVLLFYSLVTGVVIEDIGSHVHYRQPLEATTGTGSVSTCQQTIRYKENYVLRKYMKRKRAHIKSKGPKFETERNQQTQALDV